MPKEWGSEHPEYLAKIKERLASIPKPERAEFYRVVTVSEKLVLRGDEYGWAYEGLIVSMGSCDEPTPQFLLDVEDTKAEQYGPNRRHPLRVPIWYWSGKWEILDREVSGYRKEYGFPD